MNITIDSERRAELIQLIADREFGRVEGIHQSDLNYCLNKQVCRKLYPKESTDQETLIYSIGYATQRWLTGQDKDQEPIIKDNIIVTQDAQLHNLPFELKCTYMSSAKPLTESPHWVRQVAAQCYVTGNTEAYLSQFNLMGNWKWVYRPSKPEKIAELVAQYGPNWADHPTLTVYHITFTQPELDTIWGWFLKRRDLYTAMLATKDLLPRYLALPDMNDPWECDYCSYKDKECK